MQFEDQLNEACARLINRDVKRPLPTEIDIAGKAVEKLFESELLYGKDLKAAND